MTLSWSGRRQLLYYAVGLVVLLVALVAVYQSFFTAPPTCFDGKQNGDEVGVDCGGSCALVCPDLAHKPVLLWARAFPTGGNYYNAAAYIQNLNPGAGAKQVRYAFQLFDDKNILVIERDGVTSLPPIQTVPIIETNIDAGNRTVARTLFSFSEDNLVWYKVPVGTIPQLRTSSPQHNSDFSQVSTTLTNSSLATARKVTLVAVLFDQDGVARAASQSKVGDVPGKSSQEVVFTWALGAPNIVRAEITILPSF